jgi:hypothetical protein
MGNERRCSIILAPIDFQQFDMKTLSLHGEREQIFIDEVKSNCYRAGIHGTECRFIEAYTRGRAARAASMEICVHVAQQQQHSELCRYHTAARILSAVTAWMHAQFDMDTIDRLYIISVTLM